MILRESEIRTPYAKTAPLIVIDFSTLDHLDLGGGLYRYGVSLVKALAALAPDADFLLIGSQPKPVVELEEVVTGGSICWRYARFEHSRGRASYWIDQLNYARLLRRESAALFHSLHGLVPLLAPCPVVITQHDLMYELFPEYELARKSRPYRINRWAVRRFVKRVICISEATARDLHDLWAIERTRIDVVSHGSEFSCAADSHDDGRIHAELAHERPSNFVLVSLYNLEPRKNLSGLLAAVVRLRERYPSLKLVLFGRAAVTPAREAEFQRMVRELRLDDVIEQTGFIEDEDLQRLYRASDLFVFPSLYEGFGLPVLEAMASGACVVARGASAMAEVVGDAGALVETKNADVLAAAIASLLEDPRRRRQLGEAARRRARGFSTRRMASLTYASYRAALEAPIGGSRV
jgi:glycosyltransferase involved in cell wall biosynthesis